MKTYDQCISHLFDPFLKDHGETDHDREERQDLDEDGERISDLYVVFGLQTDHEGLGHFVMPLMTHVAKILVVHVIAGVDRRPRRDFRAAALIGGDSELCHEARVAHTLL